MLFAVWLIPAEPVQSVLQQHINTLAIEHHAPQFTAHTTVFCGETSDIGEVKQAIAEVAATFPPVVLKARSLTYQSEYYKTLIIQFDDNSLLSDLAKVIRFNTDAKSRYVLNPHLSLLYKNISLAEKEAIYHKLTLDLAAVFGPSQQVTFDRIYLMTDSPEESAKAVRSWQVLAQYALTASYSK